MIGQLLLHYQVLAKLGEGGMGVVYSARDTRLGRMVALKVLPPGQSNDPKRRQRFLREARAAAALNHSNIVSIYDIGQDKGVDFIAMELVAGHSLYQLMKRGQLAIPDVLSYASQIASALAKAHAAGVVHRDLKPANVMITGDGTVKLLDFGLAQLNPLLTVADPGLDAETESAITQLGTAVGTIQYMSPEQARGEMVDERSDIFSFGVLLYEMLGGSRPFHASSAVALLHAIGYDQPKPIQELRPGIPPALQQLVSRCLNKQPEARFRSMEPVVNALKDLARTGDVSGTSAPSVGQAIPAVQGRTRLGWVLAALAAVLIVGLVFGGRSAWQLLRGNSSSSAVQQPVETSEWNRRGHAYLLRYDKAGNIDKAVECFQKALEQDHDNAPAYAGLGESYAQKFADNGDPQWLRLAQANASRAVQLNDFLADAHVSMAVANLRASKPAEAERQVRRALELDPNNGDAQLRLGQILARQNRAQEAEEAYRTMQRTHPGDWRGYQFMGALLHDHGRYQEAVACFEKASKLAPDNAAVFRLLGSTYHRLDRDAEAADALQKALAIRPTPFVLTTLGWVYYYQGRYQDAVGAFQRAISIGANEYPIWGNLGDAYRYTPGNETKSKEAYERGIQLLEQQLSRTPDDPVLLSSLAELLAKAGQKDRALEVIQRAQKSPKLDGAALFRLAVANELSGRRENALELLSRAVQTGFGVRDIQNDPDLIALRRDPGYHRRVLAQVRPDGK